MRFTAPQQDARTAQEHALPAAVPMTLPPIPGQVFQAVTGPQGQLLEPLPLPPGVRVTVTVVKDQVAR